MVDSMASAVTLRPWVLTDADVTGPMETTTGGTAPIPRRSTVRSTVDDDVNATASAARAATTDLGSGSPATVR